MILKLAAKEQGEAIVIGTHGHSALASLLMGSVAESVVRRASCTVVSIKHPNCVYAVKCADDAGLHVETDADASIEV